MADIKDGGKSYIVIGVEPKNSTGPLTDNDKYSLVRRQATRIGFDKDANFTESEAVSDSVDEKRGQPEQEWGSGPISVEPYLTNMEEYIEAILGAEKPASVQTPNTDVIKDSDDVFVKPAGTWTATEADRPYQKGIGDLKRIGLTSSGADIELTRSDEKFQPTSPGRLEIKVNLKANDGETLDNADRIPEGYWIKILGRRRTGLHSQDYVPIEKTFKLETAATTWTGAIETGDYWFHQIDALVFAGAIRDNADAKDLRVDIESLVAKPGTKSRTYRPTDDVFNRWSIYRVGAGVPALAWQGGPVQGRLELGTRNSLTMELLSRGFWDKRTPEGSVHIKQEDPDAVLDRLPFPKNVFFPHKGNVLVLDAARKTTLGETDTPENIPADTSDVKIFREFSLDFNQNADFLEGSTGSTTRLPVERQENSRRNIGVNFGVYFESGQDVIEWNERFSNGDLTHVDAYMFLWSSLGQEFMHRITIHEFELTAVPRKEFAGSGPVQRTIAGRGIREGRPVAMNWEVVSDELDREGVLIALSEDSLGHGETATVTFGFGKTVTATDFTSAKLVVSGGGTLTTPTVVAGTNNSEFRATLTAPGSGAGRIGIQVIDDAVSEGNYATEAFIDYK